MEIRRRRKERWVVEMRMIDAETSAGKIMVIGSRMSSNDVRWKKKKDYISSGSSIFISTVCNVSLNLVSYPVYPFCRGSNDCP